MLSTRLKGTREKLFKISFLIQLKFESTIFQHKNIPIILFREIRRKQENVRRNESKILF
jgi:hypothetical protein